MIISLDETQLQFRDMLRRYVAEAIPSVGAEQHDDAPIIAGLADLGVFGLAVHPDFGGFSGDPELIMIAALELGRKPMAACRFQGVVMAARLLMASATDRAREHLECIVAGTARVAWAGAEMAVNGDWLAPVPDASAPVATVTAAGFEISGRVLGVIGGNTASLLLVLAQLDGEPAVFAVDPSAIGAVLRRYSLIDGTGAADVLLEQVVVGMDALLLSGPLARMAVEEAMNYGLMSVCAEAVGCAEQAVSLARDYLGLREQFGKPLSQFQALQHQVADMFIAADDARSAVYGAASALRAGGAAATAAASACKYKVMEVALRVTGQALHLHGGIGFTTEYAIGHHFRRAAVDQAVLGGREYHFARYRHASARKIAEQAATTVAMECTA